MKKWLFLLLFAFFQPIFAAAPLDGVTEFGWEFFQTAAKNKQNTIFSPYSIYSCMAMTAAGAQGETLKEMQKTFHFPSNLTKLSDALTANNESLAGHLKVANSLWVAKKFQILPAFKKTVQDFFHASVQSVDFSDVKTVDTINTWIGDNTDQKITNLLSAGDIDGATRLILTNALYFSGKFLKPFDPRLTGAQNFWTGADTLLKMPMMEQMASFLYTEDDQFQTIALPLEATQVALVIFLPKEKTFTTLKLSSKRFLSTIESLGIHRIHLRIPKFTVKQRLDLKENLSQLGLKKAFSSEANFSGIDGKKDLYLSKVVHEAFFALDENGVVAAAATAASMSVKSAPTQPPIEFNADHPFIYALVDLQSKVPFFIGELTSPP